MSNPKAGESLEPCINPNAETREAMEAARRGEFEDWKFEPLLETMGEKARNYKEIIDEIEQGFPCEPQVSRQEAANLLDSIEWAARLIKTRLCDIRFALRSQPIEELTSMLMASPEYEWFKAQGLQEEVEWIVNVASWKTLKEVVEARSPAIMETQQEEVDDLKRSLDAAGSDSCKINFSKRS